MPSGAIVAERALHAGENRETVAEIPAPRREVDARCYRTLETGTVAGVNSVGDRPTLTVGVSGVDATSRIETVTPRRRILTQGAS
jgi:hypothetical protein